MSLNGNSEVPGGTGGGKALGLLKLFLAERQGTPGHHGGVAHPLVIQLPAAHEVPPYLAAVIRGFGPIPVHGIIWVLLLRGDRMTVVSGMSLSLLVYLVGRRIINTQPQHPNLTQH